MPLINIKLQKIERDIKQSSLYEINIRKILEEENNVLEIYLKDYKHPIYLRNGTADVWTYREILEKHEYSFFAKKEPEYIIDAGANIGMASIYFANKYKGAKIIAIEPEGSNFEMLKRNTKNYANITAINAALWNVSGEITLFDTGLSSTGFMVETNASALKPVSKAKHLVKALTVEEIMRQFNIDFIDIIKIDIEGSEKEVFESCKNWINKTKCVIIELHEQMKKGCNEAFYKNIKYFDQVGEYGEDIYLSRDNYIKML